MTNLLLRLTLAFALFITAIVNGQNPEGYNVEFDLREVVDDRIEIAIRVPKVECESIEYHMPRIVPGTYSISDFGRFISEFKALDSSGMSLPVMRIDHNRWKIDSAHRLHQIVYWIDDTFDGELGKTIFEPGGSNFQTDTNFVLNLFAMIGFLEDREHLPFRLEIDHPEKLYGVTALNSISRDKTTDVFHASDYFTMHDSPIMYSHPDTASLNIANATIEVMVYSPGLKITAREIMDRNRDLFLAASEYLGGELPVDRYTQLIYLWDGPTHTGSMGALEHSYSTVFSMPDLPDSVMGAEIRNISAHEFFHIVTPLTIHSEEIHNYDWIDPKMSEHLWFYEGVTEYVSHHMQVKYGLITKEEFLAIIRDKMLSNSNYYDDALPFTTMSENCLDIYEEQYGNVYQKGALIGMCLDLYLLNWSEGNYGIQNLISDLQKRYGADRAFEDEAFFDAIAEITTPDIREFFVRHLESYEPLPYEELLKNVGVEYIAKKTDTLITFGNISLGYNPETQRLYIADLTNANSFGQSVGYEIRDELISINGFDLTNPEKVSEEIEKWRESTKVGKKVVIRVARPTGDGFREVKLKSRVMLGQSYRLHKTSFMISPNSTQLLLQNAWLNP